MNNSQLSFILWLKRDGRMKNAAKDKRRDRHEIVAEILKTAQTGKIKTHIMYRAKLSYTQINEYLPMLVEKGFLENTTLLHGKQRTTVYRTTSKGLQFMENLEFVSKLWTKNLQFNELDE
jgi:predicted transcriptional regulator